MKKAFTVRYVPKEERPRERLEKFGAEALSGQELIALVLGRGISGESVMMSAQKLLSKFGSLLGMQEASLEDLKDIRGLGQAKAAQIKACFEIARRIHISSQSHQTKGGTRRILSPHDVYLLVKGKIKNYDKEHFF